MGQQQAHKEVAGFVEAAELVGDGGQLLISVTHSASFQRLAKVVVDCPASCYQAP